MKRMLGLLVLWLGTAEAWNAGPKACKRNECGDAECRGGVCWYRETEKGAIATGSGGRDGNMHLWLVNRALNMLAASSDPWAKAAAAKLREPQCAGYWMDGLWDADDLPALKEPGDGKGTHFYNAARLDYDGYPTKVLGYMLGAFDTSEWRETGRNARNSTRWRLHEAGDLHQSQQCYDLGIALHYLTDLTQPMHSSGFSALHVPVLMHVNYEDWLSERQSEFEPNVHFLSTPTPTRYETAMPAWDGRWKDLPIDSVLYRIAERSNQFAPYMMRILVPFYNGNAYYRGDERSLRYERWALSSEIVHDAIQSTASCIYSIVKTRRTGRVVKHPDSDAIFFNETEDPAAPPRLRHIPDPGTFFALGFVPGDVSLATWAPKQPEGLAYPVLRSEFIGADPYPDLRYGKLINHRGTVCLLDRGERRCIATLKDFERLGWFHSQETIPMSDDEIARIPNGSPISLESFLYDGLQLRDPKGLGIYWIYSGRRKQIPNPASFLSLGLRPLHRDEPDVLGLAPDVPFPSIPPGKSPLNRRTGAVYWMSQGYKHHIENPYTLDTLGINWGDVIEVADTEPVHPLDTVPSGFRIGLKP